MFKNCLFLTVIAFFCSPLMAQEDSIASMQEVVVTATRTLKSTGNLPVPITVITRKQIQQSGLQKISDVLQQSGFQLASNILGQSLQGYPNPFGSGIQLQGLDAGYTLILMDGQPLTGRNAGVLNLDRIAINNVKQIEIIRGPAASLYGADALAGVINIITDEPQQYRGTLQLSYGSFGTTTTSLSQSLKVGKVRAQIFGSRSSARGYDLDEQVYGKTTDPYRNYAFSIKTNAQLSSKLSIKNTARYFTQKQFNDYLVYTAQIPAVVTGEPVERDWGLLNELKWQHSAKAQSLARLYLTGYENNAQVYLQKDGNLFDRSYLRQLLLRNEYIHQRNIKTGFTFLSGAGADFETINSSRYAGKKEFSTLYAFAQQEITLHKLNITGGLRFDKHRLFAAQVNPRIALSYKPGKGPLMINLSYGRGFKTPDFRQQFLFFTNSLVGYTLLGVQELAGGLTQLQQLGQIDPTIDLSSYQNTQPLRPEISSGINAEFKWQHTRGYRFSAGFFRNDINSLIERFALPFTKTNGQALFSYQNLQSVFTQGMNLMAQVPLYKTVQLNMTYQFLDSKDKDVVKQIRRQEIVKRDPVSYVSSHTTLKEYGGLFNRSRHTATAQLNYQARHQRMQAGVRAVYTGRAGYSDLNGNGILDDDREYTAGYVLLGLVLSREFGHGIQLQAGADNLLAHTDALRLPHLGGRTYFVNTRISLDKIFSIKQKK